MMLPPGSPPLSPECAAVVPKPPSAMGDSAAGAPAPAATALPVIMSSAGRAGPAGVVAALLVAAAALAMW